MIIPVDWLGERQYTGALYDGTVVTRGMTYDEQPVIFDGGEYIPVHLTSDGSANTAAINAALAVGNVILDSGDFPIAPGIIINGRILNLNGAHLTSTTARKTIGFVTLCGNHPVLRNGRISGLYFAAPGEPGYVPIETGDAAAESAVKLPRGGYHDGLIESVYFDHVCGYTITYGGEYQLPEFPYIENPSPTSAPESGWCEYQLHDGFPYVSARHAYGVGYYISDDEVVYKFYDSNDSLIEEKTGIPGEAILKPEGAVKVLEHVTIDNFVFHALMEYKYDNSLTIRDCDFVCNQRLGIANLPGISTVIDTRSVSNGYPRLDHTGISWDSSTSGFIDIEDVQSPILTVINCSSTLENLGVASRAYKLIVEDSHMYVRVYAGWEAVVRSNDGPVVCNNISVDTSIDVYDSNLTSMADISATPIGTNMRIHNCTVNISNVLNYLPGFKSVVDTQIIGVAATLSRVVIGEITGTYDCNIQLATKSGSDLTLMLPSTGRKGVRVAFGDCYGISTNALILPSGHTITDCDFTIADERWCDIASTNLIAAAFSGDYVGCSFDISEDVPFRAIAAWMDDPIGVTFTGCDFNISDGLCLYTNIKSGSVVEYVGCTINGEAMTQADAERITAHSMSGITVIVS